RQVPQNDIRTVLHRRQLVALKPKNKADDEGDKEAVGVVLVEPPVVGKLHEHRRVREDDGESYGDGSQEIFGGRDTHTNSLSNFRRKRAISPAKTIGDMPKTRTGENFAAKSLSQTGVRDNHGDAESHLQK